MVLPSPPKRETTHVQMSTEVTGPLEKLHDEVLVTTATWAPDDVTTERYTSSDGGPAAMEDWLYHPGPSDTPTTFSPSWRRLVTSEGEYRMRFWKVVNAPRT